MQPYNMAVHAAAPGLRGDCTKAIVYINTYIHTNTYKHTHTHTLSQLEEQLRELEKRLEARQNDQSQTAATAAAVCESKNSEALAQLSMRVGSLEASLTAEIERLRLVRCCARARVDACVCLMRVCV